MIRYVLARVAGLLVVLFILSIITFALMHGIPGGPWEYGQRPFSAQQIAALEARYGLDKPLWQQYLTWLSGVVRFDFGDSFEYPGESVTGIIARTWPVTFHLGIMAVLLSFSVGIPLGIVAAMRQNSWMDITRRRWSRSSAM